jgi:hypothetical protein
MKRLLCAGSMLALVGAASAADATTWYVSNVANNGYALGVDTNACTAVATPCLTIQGAMAKSSAGDTITVNPTGTPYAETSGSGYLSFAHVNLTLRTDPNYVVSVGKALLRSTASGSRILNVPNSGDAVQNLVLDGANTTGSGAVSVQSGVSFSMSGVDFKNMGSGTTLAISQAANSAVVLDKVTLTAANGNTTGATLLAPGTNAGTSLTLTGSTVSGVYAAVNPGGHNGTTLIRLGASADGTRNTLSNLTYGVIWPSGASSPVTNANVDIEATDFSGTFTEAIGGQASYLDTVTSLTIKTNSFANASYPAIQLMGSAGSYGAVNVQYNQYSGSNAFLYSAGTGLSNSQIKFNTITQTAATADPISILAGWSGVEVGANTIITDQGAGTNTGHAIAIGPDGQTNMAANTAAATTTVSLGDVSSDAYIDQPVAVTIQNGSQIASSFSFKLSAQGAPTGTISAYLAADNAGVAGSTIETSDLSGITLGTFSASQITSTPTWFQFWLPAHAVLATGTYHLVLAYSGTPDPANYVKLAANGSAANVNHAADGASWSAGSASALYLLQQAAFDIVDPLVHDNIITISTTGQTGVHDIALFGTLGGKMYRNQTYGGSIGLIAKLADGSVGGHPLLAYDNLIFQGNSTNNRQAIRDKGARGFGVYQNTVVLNGDGAGAGVTADNDFDPNNTPQFAGQPSQGFASRNNVIYSTAGVAGGAYLYVLGSTTGSPGSIKVINPTLDYDLIFPGTNIGVLADIRTGSQFGVATLAAMQALGLGLHDKVADPLLANAVAPTRSTDFAPAFNSPAAGMGATMLSIVLADFNGTAFTAKPAVGAINLPSRLVGGRVYANGRALIN